MLSTTNTAGSKDWLTFSVVIDPVPRNFLSADAPTSDVMLPRRVETETLDRTLMSDPLLDYACEMAGTSADLDSDFEAAAIEGWFEAD